MLAWMIYAFLVGLLLAGAARVTEQAARYRGLPTRWPWLLAMVASLVLPMAIATLSVPRPDIFRPEASRVRAEPLNLRDTTSIPLASRVIDWSGAASYTSSSRTNVLFTDIWLGSSITLMLFLGLSTASFHRHKRHWASGMLCGVPVLVSRRIGPAVVGLLRSRIVVPAWVLDEPPGQQRYVMAHEQSHLAARDPLLVAVAMGLLALMPWNPLMWWQFHRLRCAIEVDCDARILRDGGNVVDYCETLILVGQNQSGYVGAVTAMSESRSFLERRIRIMLSMPGKWVRGVVFSLLSVAFGMVIFATQVTPPSGAASSVSSGVAVSPGLLDAYAGYYELSDYSLATVARKGDGLTVTPIGQFVAQGTIDVSPINDSEFSVPTIDVTLSFTNVTDRHAGLLVVREHGIVAINAPRVDEVTAGRIRGALADRVRDQKPFPDSERILHLILSNSESGEGMTPLSAKNFARQHASLEAYFSQLGPVESYRFEGVTDYGWDIYDVQHQHGAQQVFIQLDKQGLLVNSVMRRQ